MKFFVVFSIFAVSAYGARLDNQYIPPPANAQSAGGYNLEAPRQALPSNVQNRYSAPAGGVQTNYQQQNYQRPGLNQGTYTSQSTGNGFQSVSAGSFSNNVQRPQTFQQRQPQQYQPAPQQSYQPAPQPSTYQPAQSTYQNQPQYNYRQQDGYNQVSTTPIPILKCE
jgi:hypothetical protein